MSRVPPEHYALLKYFGDLPSKPLSAEEAGSADFDTRIASIGRFLVSQTKKLHRKLSAEGKASFDPEDILLEIWMELKKRNDAYDWRKANYRTFVARIIRNHYQEIVIRARCVKLPADASSQFRDGDPERVSLLSKTATDHTDVYNVLIQDMQRTPIEGLVWLEELQECNDRVADILGDCTVMECLALRSIGIFDDNDEDAVTYVAVRHGVSPLKLRRAMRSARAKLLGKDDIKGDSVIGEEIDDEVDL